MPSPTSTDYIIAGITDIVTALQNPTANSPLAPLSDSQTKSLQQVMDILHAVVPPIDAAVGPSIDAIDAIDATATAPPPVEPPTPLRVETPTPLRVEPTAPLRVELPIAQPLRVKTPTPRLPNVVRRSPRKHRTPHTAATTPRRSPRNHKTAHSAATTITVIPKTEAVPHWALHGNAFNPDTGELAEYNELSKCSEGALWRSSNTAEIHRLAQGHGNIKGTNTIHFIPVSSVPAGMKATYLRVVCAYRPEKDVPLSSMDSRRRLR